MITTDDDFYTDAMNALSLDQQLQIALNVLKVSRRRHSKKEQAKDLKEVRRIEKLIASAKRK
jgi:hypothetical protein